MTGKPQRTHQVHQLHVLDDRAIGTIEVIWTGHFFIKRFFPDSLKVQYVAKGKYYFAALNGGCIAERIGYAPSSFASNVVVCGFGYVMEQINRLDLGMIGILKGIDQELAGGRAR